MLSLVHSKNTNLLECKKNDLQIDSLKKDINPNYTIIKNKCASIENLDIENISNKKQPKNGYGIVGCGEVIYKGEKVDLNETNSTFLYVSQNGGAYSSYNIVHENYLIRVPDKIDYKYATAIFFKALEAYNILTRVFIVRDGNTVLIHNATNETSKLLAKMSRIAGSKIIIGTVMSNVEDYSNISSELIFDHIIKLKNDEIGKDELLEIEKISNTGIDVVFDNVGGKISGQSLSILSKFGILVIYAQIKGKTDKVSLEILRARSLYITYPSLFDYKINSKKFFNIGAFEVFNLVISKSIYCKYSESNIESGHPKYIDEVLSFRSKMAHIITFTTGV